MLKGRTIKAWKTEKVKSFTQLMEESKIVGVVNLSNLPTKQLQKMREKLRENVDMIMTKKRLMKLALRDSKKKDIQKLEEHLSGMPAMLFSNENPFKLYSIIKKNKSKAPIKPGQVAPNDIVIPAGPTGFDPGPVIGELGALGIPAGVENGKVAVQKDSVVAKEGDVVSEQVAGILNRLGIEPMDIGLDLIAVYEDGDILTKDVLNIDEEQYEKDFKTAAAWAFNLAFNAAFPTKDNLPLLIGKAHTDSLALATEQDILTDETVKNVLAKAEAQAQSLQTKVPDVPEPKKEEPAAEAVEEKAEETAVEAPKEVAEEKAEAPAKPSEVEEEVVEAPKAEAKEEKVEETAAPAEAEVVEEKTESPAEPEAKAEKVEETKETVEEAKEEPAPQPEVKADSKDNV